MSNQVLEVVMEQYNMENFGCSSLLGNITQACKIQHKHYDLTKFQTIKIIFKFSRKMGTLAFHAWSPECFVEDIVWLKNRGFQVIAETVYES